MLCCQDLSLCPSLPYRSSCVPFMLLFLAVRTHTAAVHQAEALKRKLMDLTGPTVDVVEGIDQAVILKFGVLQVGSEMCLAVRNQAGQAGFQGLAGAVHARVT